jgi:hypothetical protein
MGADCRVAARDNCGVGEAPSKRVLLIVAYDWTDWLALGLIESAGLAVLIMFLFQAPISDWRA